MNARIIFPELGKAVNAAHPRGGMQTASFCICGSGSGGPTGSPACRDLRRLQDFLDYLDVDVFQCPECRALILPSEKYTNRMTRKTWEEEGKLCPNCRYVKNRSNNP